jgi:tetratricopeptide (TPR) repeat protein
MSIPNVRAPGVALTVALLTVGLSTAAYGQETAKPAGPMVQAFDRCADPSGSLSVDQRIAACTQVIDSGALKGKSLALVLGQRGVLYSQKHQLDPAIRDLDQAIQLDPSDAQALNSRGFALYEKGQHDRAIQDLNRAIALEPSLTIALVNRGNAYRAKGQSDRAIKDYDQVIEDLPQEGIGYFYRGRAYLDQRNPDRAIKDLDRAITLAPKNFGAFHYRGQAYADKGDYDRAIQDYDAALKFNPTLADTRRNRAAALERKNGSNAPTGAAAPPAPRNRAPRN